MSEAQATFTPADRVRRIRVSPSTAAAARVRELKDQGQRILDLTVGEPDFDTPEHIKAAAIEAIRNGETKYTSVNGTSQLRAAIQTRMQRQFGLRVDDESITVGGGGKQVIFLAFMASLNAGDEVIIPTPYWVSYPDMVKANDGTPVFVETTADDRFKLTAEQLYQAITPNTRWLVLNSPGNPTGVAYSREELTVLAEVLLRHPQVRVLTDEIYDEIIYTGERIPSLYEVAPELRDRVLMVNGVSKSYAMTGWRLGYAVGDPSVIKAINLLQSQTSSCPSSISQAAAAAALSGDQSCVKESLTVYRDRRDRAVALLREIPGLNPTVPDGAFYLFVECSELIGRITPDGNTLVTDQDVILYFLNEAKVAAIQGSAYGAEGHFRMSFATDTATIEEAIAALAQATEKLR